jgi:hypothetical protein
MGQRPPFSFVLRSVTGRSETALERRKHIECVSWKLKSQTKGNLAELEITALKDDEKRETLYFGEAERASFCQKVPRLPSLSFLMRAVWKLRR